MLGGQGEDRFQTHIEESKLKRTDRPTSAEASDVTSIRFSARKANTAAARTERRKRTKYENQNVGASD